MGNGLRLNGGWGVVALFADCLLNARVKAKIGEGNANWRVGRLCGGACIYSGIGQGNLNNGRDPSLSSAGIFGRLHAGNADCADGKSIYFDIDPTLQHPLNVGSG